MYSIYDIYICMFVQQNKAFNESAEYLFVPLYAS